MVARRKNCLRQRSRASQRRSRAERNRSWESIPVPHPVDVKYVSVLRRHRRSLRLHTHHQFILLHSRSLMYFTFRPCPCPIISLGISHPSYRSYAHHNNFEVTSVRNILGNILTRKQGKRQFYWTNVCMYPHAERFWSAYNIIWSGPHYLCENIVSVTIM